ncbi:hypothetical protein CRE_30731 [Caenorhabditis remanei]|uniref:Pinin/SDK/MemA protein domain-containing protein n=1 Tax=Caenorhabditis remanei TaxID=31234 RepID=E3LU00_CAERE|nr:hypothetical protein CRE_30731 [Caenorhabditis remanei]
MEKMFVEDLDSDINAARDKLRNIDEKVTTLNGRPPRQRISYNDEPEEAPLRNVGRDAFGLKDEASPWTTRREIEAPAGIRKRISIEDRIDRRGAGGRQSFDNQKRQRPDYLDNEADEEEFGKRQKRSLQSTVVMPALDSKGREEKIEKLKETENKDSKQRNRRLFSSLVMGTLTSFKKTEKKTAQQEKQEEVEKRLEETKKKDLESRNNELLNKRREQEKELQGLQRKKAMIQYAEQHVNQLKLMRGLDKGHQQFRSLELKQATERQLDDQIVERQEKLKRDLEGNEGRECIGESREISQDDEGEDDEYEDDGEEKNENGGY